MERDHLKTRKFIHVENTSTGKTVKFETINEHEMLMYHPESDDAIYKIIVHETGAEIVPLGNFRTPTDAGKCLMECSRGCKGDFTCVAECAVLCATIII